MSETETKTIKERVAIRQKHLDDWEKGLHLPNNHPPGTEEELQGYLNMPRDEIEKKSPEMCAQIAYRLAQFSFYFQRCYNRERGILIWAETELNKVISPLLNSYDKYMKHEAKVAAIVRENSAASNLHNTVTYAKERIERLTYLSAAIRNLSDIMIDNKRAKIAASKG